MNEFIKKYRKKLFRMFRTHTFVKLVILIGILCFVAIGIKELSINQMKYTMSPKTDEEEQVESLGEIQIDSPETLVAETDSKRLYIDGATLNLRVEDKVSKRSWNAIQINGTEEEKSLIKITFMGEDNTFSYWDAFNYAVKNKTYQIQQINGGVRINLNMKEADSNRINEYMPQKITIEKYETTFLKGLDEKVLEGVIKEEDAQKYKATLGLIYSKDEEKNCYYNKYSTAPPLSAVTQLIQMTKILNYTTEQLMEDNAEFDINVKIVEPANFIIPIEAVLDGDDFVISIPTNQIHNANDYYTIARIDVLPYFGAVGPSEVEDGYILVPDGAGALLELNQFNTNYGSYSRELYNNTYFRDYYYLNSYKEMLHMPVFGMTYGKGKASTGGFMGIIEQGDDTAFITATQASPEENEGGGKYNKVFSSFDVMQYAQVSILGPYDSSGGRFMSSTGMMEIDCTVRYKLFGDAVTYFDMAKSYQEYLVERYDLSIKYDEKAKFYLDVIGSLTLKERILGIPHNKIISMTTYTELQEILSDLGDIPLVINYLGMFNGGLNHRLMNKADLTSENGTKKQLEELMLYAEDKQQELFFQADFSKIYEKGNGFKNKIHGIYDFSEKPISVYGYNYATGELNGLSNHYNMLNPIYLSTVIDKFLAKSKDYKNLYIQDLATHYYANYKKEEIVSPAESQIIINENLEKIAQTKNISLSNPQINKIAYGKYATNISRESSGYGGFAVEIPFRQLVMNGLISYTTLNVNETGINKDYFLLQALELGSYPKFVITAKSVDVLKNSSYSDFISTQYSLISEDIKELYQGYDQAFKQINSMEIKDHNIVEDNVFATTYANGVKVITNYNKYPVVLDGQVVEALGYMIIQ